jgi:hypothetical protein
MSFLDQNDSAFRPIPLGDWRSIWDNAGETRDKLGILIIQYAIRRQTWQQDAAEYNRLEDGFYNDTCNADND